MKIGVIIQGPLVTFGDGSNNSATGFDTSKTVQGNVQHIKQKKLSYIISTWQPKSSREVTILKNLRKKHLNIITSASPTVMDPQSIYKQAYSTHIGLKALQKISNFDYFVKIRTDMLLPKDFWSWLMKLVNQRDNKLLVSELFTGNLFYLGDFVIGGPSQLFSKYVKTIFSYQTRSLYPTAAFDQGMKYAKQKGYFNFQKSHLQSFFMFYILLFRRKKLRQIWNSFISHELVTLPKETWKRIVWRGRLIENVISPDVFKFNSFPETIESHGLVTHFWLISNDYLRVWNKKNQLSSSLFRKYLATVVSSLIFSLAIIKSLIVTKLLIFIPRRKIILGRFACIGKEVLKVKERSRFIKVANQQKVRLDLFLNWLDGETKPKTDQLKQFSLRPDVFPLIEQQADLPWLHNRHNYSYFIMDSFAELTDKKFVHRKEKWCFSCHYKDMDHSKDFDQLFRCDGLLDQKEFASTYRRFFEWFENEFPHTQVFFIHTPTALDGRRIYQRRAKAILKVIQKLETEKPFLHSLTVAAKYVHHAKTDKYPYHFNTGTYQKLLQSWMKQNQIR